MFTIYIYITGKLAFSGKKDKNERTIIKVTMVRHLFNRWSIKIKKRKVILIESNFFLKKGTREDKKANGIKRQVIYYLPETILYIIVWFSFFGI